MFTVIKMLERSQLPHSLYVHIQQKQSAKHAYSQAASGEFNMQQIESLILTTYFKHLNYVFSTYATK